MIPESAKAKAVYIRFTQAADKEGATVEMKGTASEIAQMMRICLMQDEHTYRVFLVTLCDLMTEKNLLVDISAMAVALYEPDEEDDNL